jgi:glycosyltransferase involved in cell wall biosynthesis
MDWRANCVAVIPCLNEDMTIVSVVQGVRNYVDAVIVVDDGSNDRTGALSQPAGAEVLRNPVSLGKGAALRAGWTQAHRRGFAWALTMDGDGQHAPEDIPALFRCAEESSAALVVGNRMPDCAHMPWLRRVVNRWMSRRLSLAAGRPLPDSQCGFRLMKLDAWASVCLTTSHFEIESELLLAFVAAGLGVEFVPVRAIYKSEQSKIHPLRDTMRWLRWRYFGLSKRQTLGKRVTPNAPPGVHSSRSRH